MFFGRLVVGIVAGVIALVVVTIAFVSAQFGSGKADENLVEVPVGPWSALVSEEVPPAELVGTAVVAMLVIAICAVTFEVIAALMSISPRRRRLAWLRADDPQPLTDHPRVRVTVLVPAHNEELALPVTLGALAQQNRPPDRVIVVGGPASGSRRTLGR